MTKAKNDAIWSRWAVVLTAVGVAITGGALWYNNFFGSDEKNRDRIEIDQSASDNAVNVGGDNSGSINVNGVDQ
ncbi:MAG: hypothetical protein ABJO67_15455 [Pseudoruegeria sp.]